MAQGSGLPLPKTGDARTVISGVMDGDKLSSATAWGRIAQVGKQLAASVERVGELEFHQQQARHVAETENEDADALVKLRDKHAFNPQAFEAEARGYLDGKVEASPTWDVARRKRYIGGKLEATLGTILNETRSRDTRLAGEALDSRRLTADNEVMGLAIAGKVGTPDWAAANATYQGVLDTAVSTKLISPEKAEMLRDDLAGRAQGEHAGRSAVGVYRERGFAAATEYLQKNILENDGLSLKPSQRQAIFNRGLAAVRLAQTEDKDARTEVVTASRDLRSRIKSQQPVDTGEVNDTIEGLRRTGAVGELHRLSVEWGVRQQTDPFRHGNMSLKQMAGTVAEARGTAVQSANAQAAMQFFQSRGYTPAQAAGIVGNLVQESGPLNPTLSHDGGTGVGIAGWRLERRTALRQFAAARGKTETDFQTQLEFLDQELNTTEAGAGARLKAAKTAAEAAEAFIHFERPAGYTAANPRAGHGFANRVRNAEMLAGQQPAAVPYAGEIAKGVQGVFVQQVRGAWPKFKEQIDKGVPLDEDDLTSIRYAAALSGDANWQREVEGIVTAQRVGQGLADQPAAVRSAGLGQVQEELKRLGLPEISQQTVVTSLEKQFERQSKLARENPVGYWIERGGKAPDPLNLSNPQTAAAGAKDRYSVARLVAMREEIPPGSPFTEAERQTIAGAIRSGNPEQTAAGFETLHAAPDDMLIPALKTEAIKSAVIGAARSTDPVRFMAAMSAVDRLYARAPEEVAAIYGGDVFKQLQDWQAKLRYHSPQELAEVLKRRDDPQVREREKINVEAGEKIAREKKPESLIGEWQSAFGLFGAGAPADARTRDAWMADYVNLFGERYANSLDKDTAHKQAIERMKHYWRKSDVNGGRLTLYPPELTYQPDANGSFGWMRTDLENDIRTKTGRPPSDYTIIADPTTQREVDNRQPASYLIAVKNDQTGEWDLMRGADARPQRYKWDATKTRQDAREQFQRQRDAIFAPGMIVGGGF